MSDFSVSNDFHTNQLSKKVIDFRADFHKQDQSSFKVKNIQSKQKVMDTQRTNQTASWERLEKDLFNPNVMLRLVTKQSSKISENKVSTSLFLF